MSIYNVNDGDFREMVRKQGVTLVEFGTKYCPPCKVLIPILEELDYDYGEQLSVLKVDCDESPIVVSEYQIMSTPTVIMFHNGEPVEKIVGLRSRDVYESLLVQYR